MRNIGKIKSRILFPINNSAPIFKYPRLSQHLLPSVRSIRSLSADVRNPHKPPMWVDPISLGNSLYRHPLRSSTSPFLVTFSAYPFLTRPLSPVYTPSLPMRYFSSTPRETLDSKSTEPPASNSPSKSQDVSTLSLGETWTVIWRASYEIIKNRELSASDFRKLRLGYWLIRLCFLTGGIGLGYGLKDIIDPLVQPKLTNLHKWLGFTPKSDNNILFKVIVAENTVKRSAVDYLKDVLDEHTEGVYVVAIVGVEGSGKTELAKCFAQLRDDELCKRAPNTLRTVVFLERNNLDQEYRNFARKLNINPEYHTTKDLVDLVNKQLALRPDWLLIFDNIENLEDFQQVKPYFPLTGKQQGHIIITSRESFHAVESNVQLRTILLDSTERRFSKKEGVELFDRVLGNQHDAVGKNEELKALLVQHLGFMPLAIKRAAADLRQYKASEMEEAIKKYIEQIKQAASELLAKKKYLEVADHQFLNKITHQFLFKKLSKHAIDALLFIVFLNPDNIHSKLLADKFNLNDEGLAILLDELKSLQILHSREENVFQVHRSLKGAILEWQLTTGATTTTKIIDESKLRLFEQKCLQAVLQYFKENFSPDNRFTAKQGIHEFFVVHTWTLFHHVENLFDIELSDQWIETITQILDATANYYSTLSDPASAQKFLEKAKNFLDVWLMKRNADLPAISQEDTESLQSMGKSVVHVNHGISLVYARILYSLGRLYFYFKDDTIDLLKAEEYIARASKLNDDYNSNSTNVKTFEAVLCKVHGLFYIALEFLNVEKLKQAILGYEGILEDQTIYNNRGTPTVVAYDPNREDDPGAYTRMECYNQIARAYQKLVFIGQSEILPRSLQSLFGYWENHPDKFSDQEACYQQALLHSLGAKEFRGDEKEVTPRRVEGSLQLCYKARRNDPQKGCAVEGYPDREPMCWNVLANTLLLLPTKNVYADYKEELNRFASYSKTTFCRLTGCTDQNNLALAEAIFKCSVDWHKNKKPNFPLADAYMGLANVYLARNEFDAAKEMLTYCMDVQKQMKRRETHQDMVKARQLYNFASTKNAVEMAVNLTR